ncbi:Pyruvate kinase family protein [Perilla frutescens var. frutescens]|nr:Pyruvate kinase family protein [Perilla frutescens var. frutescens]
MGVLCNSGSKFCSNFVANGKQESIMSMSPYDVHERRPKTKIVCTLGPSSRSSEMIEKLLRAGMNVARFNFSHGNHAYHQETLDNLRTAVRLTGLPCAVMLDTKGPEIRTGLLKDGKAIELKQGQEITITTDYNIIGDENIISMSYKKLAEDLMPQSLILCSDGTISLRVLECNKDLGLVRCRCENTALLGERKNVNLPGVIVDLPTLTDKDIHDIMQWGLPNAIDIIALSFVRKGSDLLAVRNLLGEHAKSIILMSKVENQEGVANLDEIVANSDALMVARGDLGMEIPIEKIFVAQKLMIEKCNALGKPVVTATQMLESMIKSPRPTRAEATDVANAVIDGTDCVMLSGETAAGAYPVQAVETMAKICIEAESCLDHDQIFGKVLAAAVQPLSPLERLACATVQTANSSGAAVIVVIAEGSGAAELVAKYRPSAAIVWRRSDEGGAVVLRGVTALGLALNSVNDEASNAEDVVELAMKKAKARNLCRPGDTVVDFEGVLNNLQDWELSFKEKDKKMRADALGKGNLDPSSQSSRANSSQLSDNPRVNGTRTRDKTSSSDNTNTVGRYEYLKGYEALSRLTSRVSSQEGVVDANSEKELGNEFFKQKKFNEAIDCYSRSIALSPTAVAYANRAMAYIKVKSFLEAENDCTEALDLDDRYIKAYSRRSTARKELGKLNESIDDIEFALRLEPQNQEIKKQYAECKALLEKVILKKTSGPLAGSLDGARQEKVEVDKKKYATSSPAGRVAKFVEDDSKANIREVSRQTSMENKGNSIPSNESHAGTVSECAKRKPQSSKLELRASVQELAAKAAELAKAEAAKNIAPPTSAYQFEASWRGLSGDRELQARLLKVTLPAALPGMFKNALSAPILIDIIRCIATFFMEDMVLGVEYLQNFTKVPRFDMIIMCLSPADKADLLKIWSEIFSKGTTEYAEILGMAVLILLWNRVPSRMKNVKELQ